MSIFRIIFHEIDMDKCSKILAEYINVYCEYFLNIRIIRDFLRLLVLSLQQVMEVQHYLPADIVNLWSLQT